MNDPIHKFQSDASRNKILSQLSWLYSNTDNEETELFSDVAITCSNGRIFSHKLVLAAVSPMLYDALKNHDDEVVILLPEFNIEELNQCLKNIFSSGKDYQHFLLSEALGISTYQKICIKEEVKENVLDIKEDYSIDNELPETDNDYLENPVLISLSKQCKRKAGKVLDKETVERKVKEKTSGHKRKEQCFLWNHFDVNNRCLNGQVQSATCKVCKKVILKTGKINQINGKLKTHLRCHKHLLDEVPELRKKNMCSRCGKSYFTKQQKDNCEKRHTKSFDFFCTQEKCGKGFLLKSEFEAHLRVHSGESPFQCNICGYQFKQKTHLTRHTRRKHL